MNARGELAAYIGYGPDEHDEKFERRLDDYRAQVLREAADALESRALGTTLVYAAARLRRMAEEKTTAAAAAVTPEPVVPVEDVADLNPRQRGLLDEIVKHGGTWTKQAATYLYQRVGIHQAERKAREDLAKLARLGLLTRLPEAAGCDRYQLPGGTA